MALALGVVTSMCRIACRAYGEGSIALVHRCGCYCCIMTMVGIVRCNCVLDSQIMLSHLYGFRKRLYVEETAEDS